MRQDNESLRSVFESLAVFYGKKLGRTLVRQASQCRQCGIPSPNAMLSKMRQRVTPRPLNIAGVELQRVDDSG
jgi:hypothetical protein